jgi:tRNA threonylcarbamoyladenosine biosynthesis protein TsaB
MEDPQRKNLTLAIETAILGGSISLLENGDEIDSWLGGTDVSRSEDLLLNISELLAKNLIDLAHIRLIGVSTGPGSYTGIRVGVATALGLKNALNIPCVGIPVLPAIYSSFPVQSEQTVAAIPIGRGDVCLQFFGAREKEELHVIRADDLLPFLSDRSPIKAFFHENLHQNASELSKQVEIVNVGAGIARYIGIAAEKGNTTGETIPIYVRDFV